MRLGDFELEARLGRGGMGEVWRARHVLHGTAAAVKLLAAVPRGDAMTAGSGPSADLLGEVRAIAALDHPNVLRVYDFGLSDAGPWMAMELAAGSIESAPPADWASLRSVLLDALAGLAHAHAHGVVHRDVKPANLLRAGRVKLADFGLAWRLGPDQEAADERPRGTPAFMAPEQFRGRWRDHGPWTDVYALGCAAWLLATGLPVYADADWTTLGRAHAFAPLPPFSPVVPVPDGFAGWLARCLAKAPGDRFRFAADAAFALRALGEAAGRGTVVLGAAETYADLDGAPLPDEPAATEAAPAPRPPIGALPAAIGSAGDLHLRGSGLGLFDLRSLPMIGRRAEQRALWDALADVHAAGKPRLAVVRGGTGLGKTRLLRAFTALAHAEGAAHVLSASYGRVPDRRDGLPRLLASWFVTEGCDEAERATRTRLTAPPADVAALVALQGGASPPGGAEERWRVVERLLCSLDRPSIVWLDDVQWGPEAVAFAQDLVSRGAAPALVVLGVREEADLQGLAGDPDLTLGPLGEADRQALVRELLRLDEGLAAVVVERTGGHPLFAVALVAHWVHSGKLLPDALGFRLAPGARPEAPEAMADLLADRLDAVLLEGLRAGAALGAVLGETFPLEQHRALAEAVGVADARRSLRALEAAGLGGARGGDWSFAHALVREALAAQGRGSWQVWNAAAAQLAGDAARRGLHLVEAGRPEEAFAPLIEASVAARADGDTSRALRLLAAAEQALDAAGADPHDLRRASVWGSRGSAHVYRAQMREATDCLRRAEAILRVAGDRDRLGECLLNLAHAARFAGDDPQPLLREAIALLGPSRPEEAARARAILGSHLIVNERYEAAVAELARAVEELDRIGSEKFLGTALFWLGNAFAYQHRAAEALPPHLRALEVWRRAGNRPGVLQVLGMLVGDRCDLGEVDEARAMLPEIDALAATVGAPMGTGAAVEARGSVAEASGDWAGALRAAEEGAAIWAGTSHALSFRGRAIVARIGLGDAEGAREALVALLAEPEGPKAADRAERDAPPTLAEALRGLRAASASA